MLASLGNWNEKKNRKSHEPQLTLASPPPWEINKHSRNLFANKQHAAWYLCDFYSTTKASTTLTGFHSMEEEGQEKLDGVPGHRGLLKEGQGIFF